MAGVANAGVDKLGCFIAVDGAVTTGLVITAGEETIGGLAVIVGVVTAGADTTGVFTVVTGAMGADSVGAVVIFGTVTVVAVVETAGGFTVGERVGDTARVPAREIPAAQTERPWRQRVAVLILEILVRMIAS
jgi:hypothetical protein